MLPMAREPVEERTNLCYPSYRYANVYIGSVLEGSAGFPLKTVCCVPGRNDRQHRGKRYNLSGKSKTRNIPLSYNEWKYYRNELPF